MLRLSALFLGCCVLASGGQRYCDAPPEVQAELRKAAALWDRPGLKQARSDDGRAILEALVRKYPDDIQANRRFQNDAEIPKDELIARYKARLNAKPDDPLSIYFYALTLIRKDTPEAMRLFDLALKKDSELAWAHMAMAYVYSWGRLADRAKATEHVDAFFNLCPTSYDFYTNRMLGSHGSPQLQKKVAAALRERVQAETDPEVLAIYEHLWTLEFKVTSPTEHAELRKRIAEDVRHIRKLAPHPALVNLRTIREGLKQAGDQAGVTAVEDEIVRSFPKLHEAARIVQERWGKENPYWKPGDPDQKKRERASALYAVTAKWIEQWPWEPSARADRFYAARNLQDLPPAEMKAAADQLIGFLRHNEVMYGFQPFAHQAAEEYLKRGIYIEKVPALAEEGLETVREREAGREKSDLEPPDLTSLTGGVLRATEMGAVELLAQAYMKLQQPEKAAELRARLETVIPQGDQEKATKMRVVSRVAELAGRKMDALVYLEKSLDLSPKPTNDRMKEQEAERRAELRRLWTSLGGSEETWRLRSERTSAIQEAKAGTEWKAPEKVIPAWNLTDISGKRWTTDLLAGKTVLINVWASWCGPCRAEHPHLQKLYEKLKDRTDVAIVSFNVDDQIGLVQPYMEKDKFTFPVLLANRFVMGIFDGISIPRNWLLDRNGIHRMEQIGFDESADWEQRMTAAMKDLKTAAQ